MKRTCKKKVFRFHYFPPEDVFSIVLSAFCWFDWSVLYNIPSVITPTVMVKFIRSDVAGSTPTRLFAKTRRIHWIIHLTSSKKKLKLTTSEVQKKTNEINHRTFFLEGYKTSGPVQVLRRAKFCAESNRDQVPEIPVKSQQEIFAIRVSCFLLKIPVILAFSDACILFHAKFCVWGNSLGIFSDFLGGVQQG